jgi:PAS domain S-box-containing protein
MRLSSRSGIAGEMHVNEGLRGSEERFRLLADTAPVMVWISGPDKLCNFFNKPWLNFTGRTMEQELGNGWLDGVHPGDLVRCLETYQTAFDARRDFTMEYRLRRADGVYRWILDNGVPHHTPDGSFAGYIGSCIDISDRREMEETLRDSEARYRAFFELNIVGASETRLPDGHFVRVNEALCAITGYTRDELLTMRISDLTHPEDREKTFEDFGRLARGERQSYGKDKRYVRKDGSIIWVHIEVSIVRDSSGSPAYAISIVQDITDRRRAEEGLQQSNQRYRAFFELNAVGAGEVDLSEGRFLRANDAICQITGYSRDELLGLRFTDITHPDDREEDWRQFARLVRGEIPNYRLEKRYVRKDGRIVWVQLAVTLIRDGAGNPVSELGLTLDITERKGVEQDLQQLAARLLQSQDEERWRIAQELHDETAQTIFAINLNLTHLLQTQPALDDQAKSLLDETLGMGEHVLKEIRTLSYLLHPPLLDQVGLESAVEWYVDGFVKRSGMDVKLVLSPDIGRLPAEVETALFRIVQESLTNIHRHSGCKQASIRLTKEGDRIILEVKDRGRGMAAEARVSSEDVQSLGVGISGMRQRMRQLGGQLDISSSQTGTTVTAVVPPDGGTSRD